MPFNVTPQEALVCLENLGLSPDEQIYCLRNNRLSHMARSLIRIAHGDERELVAVYNSERERDGEFAVSSESIEAIFDTPDDVINYLT